MGCWNGTCLITNTPIMEDDEVYVFPIKENIEESKSFCGSEAFYIPMMLSFQGQYDGYGRVKNCHGETLDYIFDENFIEIERKNSEDIGQFFKKCHEDTLFWRDSGRISFSMVKKDFVDYLWNRWKAGHFIETKKMTFNEMNSTIPEFMNNAKFLRCLGYQMSDDFLVSRYVCRPFGCRIWTPYNFEDHHDNAITENFLKGRMVDDFLTSVRKVWLPVVHQGSQNGFDEEYNILEYLSRWAKTEYEKDI